MRKALSLFLFIILLIFSFCQAGSAQEAPIDIAINSDFVKSDGAFIEYDTVFIPLRRICDLLGAESVDWNEEEKKATIKKALVKIDVYENKKEAYINSEQKSLPRETKIVGERLFVPVRFICESLGAKIEWDEEYCIVHIKSPHISLQKTDIDYSYTKDEIFWLARIIHAESDGEPAEGKIGVGNVVLNRVANENYPDTIYGVIFDQKDGVQFEPVINKTVYNTPSAESIMCAKRALRGENTAGDCLFFFNPDTASSSWIKNNRTYYKTIANHRFYL